MNKLRACKGNGCAMKLVSILGDSISTFEGYNPPGYSVFYDKNTQLRNGMNSVYDTWWAKVNQALKAYLCLNNSYSGSRVTGTGFPSACCDERLLHLGTEQYSPNIILVYMGCNDFGYGVKIKRDSFLKKDYLSFEYAYGKMISRLNQYYPKATVICGTLMKSTVKNREDWEFPERFAGVHFEAYNDVIRRACKKRRCFFADLAGLAFKYETLDGSHPTAKGHKTIAEAWITCLSNLGFVDYQDNAGLNGGTFDATRKGRNKIKGHAKIARIYQLFAPEPQINISFY